VTSSLPPGPTSGGSTATSTFLPAVIDAVNAALKVVLTVAANTKGSPFEGKDAGSLALTAGRVHAKGQPAASGVPYGQILLLANLASANSATSLNGSGTTLRQTTLTTTITARVTDVLPNGYLVVEGSKTLAVNSETQVITLRGVVRPADLTNANSVQSGNVAQMELKINGKGVVNDVIRRPNILYRILLGLLPF